MRKTRKIIAAAGGALLAVTMAAAAAQASVSGYHPAAHGPAVPGGAKGPDGAAFRSTPAIRPAPYIDPYSVSRNSPLITPRTPAKPKAAAAGKTPPPPVLNNNPVGGCKGYAIFTFDDGPSTDTTQTLLNEMNAENVHGIFFVIGDLVAAGAQIVRNEAASGDLVENHTWDHQSFTGASTPGTLPLTPAQVTSEIAQTQTAITSLGLPAPTMYRPPYGDDNATDDAVIRGAFGLQVVLSFSDEGPTFPAGSGEITDSRDWTGVDSAQLIQNTTIGYTSTSGRFYPGMEQSTPAQPDILAFHDTTGAQLYDALPGIVSWMNANSFCATRTMRTDATGGVVPMPAQQEPPAAQNLVVNPSLAADWPVGNYGLFPVTWPAGYITAGWGTRTATFGTTTPGRNSDAQAATTAISDWTSGTADWVIVMRGAGTSSSDTYTPTADAEPGHSYNFWTEYTGTATGSIGIVAYYRDASDNWDYWTSSYAVANSPGVWNLAWYTSPPLPAGATAVSFGLSVSGNGSVSTDDYAMTVNP
jgi:peptidoglycan/xylan/chitin deacetylase (PgdA/CDA1 family)